MKEQLALFLYMILMVWIFADQGNKLNELDQHELDHFCTARWIGYNATIRKDKLENVDAYFTTVENVTPEDCIQICLAPVQPSPVDLKQAIQCLNMKVQVEGRILEN